MYRIAKGKNKSLDELCTDYWNKLNKRSKSGAYHEHALKRKIKRAILLEKERKMLYFLSLLKRKRWKLLKELVTAKPERLLQISAEMGIKTNAGTIPVFYTMVNGRAQSTTDGRKILNIFNYKGLRSSQVFTWLAKEFDLPVCPYCNYEHTMTISRTNVNKMGKRVSKTMHLFTFDHFMIKAMYPYLSASFWNLVPCCHNCNSNLKGDDTFIPGKDIHPFLECIGNLTRFSLGGVPKVGAKSFNLNFLTETTKQSEIDQVERYNLVFDIGARYINFIPLIEHLNKERTYYDDFSKEELLNTSIKIKFADMKDVIKHIAERLQIPLNGEEALRMEKGKLRMDLAKELEIITYKGVDILSNT